MDRQYPYAVAPQVCARCEDEQATQMVCMGCGDMFCTTCSGTLYSCDACIFRDMKTPATETGGSDRTN